MSAPQPASADNQPQPAAELRLAVAFTGGVSLAVWMGGMAREMNLLLAASRIRRGESVADTSEQGGKVRDLYAALLKLLNMDCSMDVLSGTSAGGINAVILGLANVQRFDLDGLRELWFDEGSLGSLLRDPADKQPASLLYGDKVLLQGLRTTGLIVHNAGMTAAVPLAAGGALYSVGALFYGLRWPDPRPTTFGYHEFFTRAPCSRQSASTSPSGSRSSRRRGPRRTS